MLGLIGLGALGLAGKYHYDEFQERAEEKKKEKEKEAWRDKWADRLPNLLSAPSESTGLVSPAENLTNQYAPSTGGRRSNTQGQAPQAGPAPGMTAGMTNSAAGTSPATGLHGGSGFMNSLVNSESGGDWTAQNDAQGSGGRGHFGRLQFSRGRLQDFSRATGESVTPEQFMNDPDLQRKVEAWHFGDIDRHIQQNGLDQYIGETVGGVPMTRDAMRAVAHLGGKTGLRWFLESDGTHNPPDPNGTSLADYARAHGGAASGPQARASAAPGQPQGRPQGQPAPSARRGLQNAWDAPGAQGAQGTQPGRSPAPKALAGAYRDLAIDAFRNGHLEDAKPMLSMIASEGLAAHMQSFEGDPSTPEGMVQYMRHIGRGAGMFGRDPWSMVNQASTQGYRMNSIRQEDKRGERAEVETEILRDEHERNQDAYAIEQFTNMLTLLEAGMHDHAAQAAEQLGYNIDNISTTTTEIPGLGPRETVEFDWINSEGEVERTDTARASARIGKAEVEQEDREGGYAKFDPAEHRHDAREYARKAMGSDRAVNQDPERYRQLQLEYILRMQKEYEIVRERARNAQYQTTQPEVVGDPNGDALNEEMRQQQAQNAQPAQNADPAPQAPQATEGELRAAQLRGRGVPGGYGLPFGLPF